MQHVFLRFLGALLAASLASSLFGSLTVAIVVFATGEQGLTGSDVILGTLGMLPYGMVFGNLIALPTILVAVAAILGAERWFAVSLPWRAWAAIGFAVGAALSLAFGQHEPVFPHRSVTAIWFGACGLVASLVFYRLWRGFRPERKG